MPSSATEPWKVLYPPTGGGYGIILGDNTLGLTSPCCGAVVLSPYVDELGTCAGCAKKLEYPVRDEGYLVSVNLKMYEERGWADFSHWAKYWTMNRQIELKLEW